ncbi:MAG: dTDP-4-amino-4,6-dideoxygalactose transaminase [Cyanobacteria bacterium SZAS-4]|nr:dTDP-4-amino-4,6-dideoxygalactose transaminase [Cyanobacteria bacterium SZAS-4]
MKNSSPDTRTIAAPRDYAIPFNKPCFAGNEQAYIADAMATGHVSGDGSFTKKCNSLIESLLGVKKVMLTTSCTHALEMSAILLDIQPGDEVIIPSFTFVSTANAFVLRGAKPIFIDIRPDTLNLDETKLRQLITKRTKAVVPVHYGGVGCAMDSIEAICSEHNIAIVEDNAHGLLGKYQGRFLGTFGALATQSFHETKNFHCGEGGALLINDPKLVERAEIIREKGTDRSRFFRGQVDKYSWVDIGSSYLPSEILAAFLYAQLEKHEYIQNARKVIYDRYSKQLAEWAASTGVTLPVVPRECETAYHNFCLLLPSLEKRQALISHLKSNGILAVYHYLPLHSSTMGARFGSDPTSCPVTEDISDRLLRLPFFNDLTEREQNKVIECIKDFK